MLPTINQSVLSSNRESTNVSNITNSINKNDKNDKLSIDQVPFTSTMYIQPNSPINHETKMYPELSQAPSKHDKDNNNKAKNDKDVKYIPAIDKNITSNNFRVLNHQSTINLPNYKHLSTMSSISIPIDENQEHNQKENSKN